MARFARFLILALIGLGLGAGLAWFQQKEQAPPPTQVAAQQTTDAATPAQMDDASMSHGAMDHAAMDQGTMPGSSVGGAFTLTDHFGNTVTEKSWPGKMKLVYFGFTNCPDICPVGLSKIAEVLKTLGPDVAHLQTIFITTDPARDTAEKLNTYVTSFSPDILGLTGTEDQIKAVEDAYKVYAAKVPADAMDEHADHYMMDHSAYTYLVSTDDKAIEVFSKDATAVDMAQKIKADIDVAFPSAQQPASDMTAPQTDMQPAESAPVTPDMGTDMPQDMPQDMPMPDIAAPPAPESDQPQ